MSKHDTHKTELKKAHEVGLRAETILQTSLDGFCVINPDGVILETNQTYCTIIGYSKEELLEMSILDLYDEENRSIVEEMVKIVYHEGKHVYEIEQIIKYGCTQTVEVNSHRFELGKEKYILSIVREIKDRIISRKKQEELLEERTLLLDIIAHDLRNHSMVALGYLESYLSFKDSSHEEGLNFLKNTKSAIRRINSLLDNLATKIRSDLDTQTQLFPVNVLEAIFNTEIVLKELFPKNEIIIDTINIKEQNYVLADKLFEQLLLNLFTNAVRNTPGDNIKITIDYLPFEERKCFLSITDYGKGISPEERKSILNRLEKKNVNKSISGLGLHIVKTLVERYKGRFWIKSRDIDDYSKGTIFKIGLFTG